MTPLSHSVVVLYDPVQTANGSLTIRAFRLHEDFVELSAKATLEGEFLPASKVLEELPLKIRNPGIINALLFDLKAQKKLTCAFERLDLSTNP